MTVRKINLKLPGRRTGPAATGEQLARGILLSGVFLLAGCAATLPESSLENRHLEPPSAAAGAGDIPDIVQPRAAAPQPSGTAGEQTYSVVAQDLPVRELLFAMARDASLNVDIHPQVTGLVSLNAIDQTLPQLLDRISRQVSMRWSFDFNGNLLVEPDNPFWKTYQVDYVNVQRSAQTGATISSTISSVGGGGSGAGNNSSASISQSSTNDFWPSLTANLNALLGIETAGGAAGPPPLVVNPETGVIAVFGDSTKHSEVQHFIRSVESRSLQQVLIEATVVEVNLNDRYQAGVDWRALGRLTDDIGFAQNVTGVGLGNAPNSILTINGNDDAVAGTLSMLSQFGDLSVLSTPRIMALNNQSAMLRVVDNRVYFTVSVQAGAVSQGVAQQNTFTTEVQTVPVGFVMTVTPQIGANDQVTLNVRPTITRILGFVNDPNPTLADAGVESPIPELQIREIESVLKVYSGQIAVLGGLMQDSLDTNTTGVPLLSRIPGLGNLFSYRDDTANKTELIIFIRPIVIRQPSLEGDLSNYSQYLRPDGIGIQTLESMLEGEAQRP